MGTTVNFNTGKMHEHQRNNLRFRGIVSGIPRLFAIIRAAKRTAWQHAYCGHTSAASRVTNGTR